MPRKNASIVQKGHVRAWVKVLTQVIKFNRTRSNEAHWKFNAQKLQNIVGGKTQGPKGRGRGAGRRE